MTLSESELTPDSRSRLTLGAVGEGRTEVVRVRSPLPWLCYGLALVSGWVLAALVTMSLLGLAPSGIAAMLAAVGVVPLVLCLPIPVARRVTRGVIRRHPWMAGEIELSLYGGERTGGERVRSSGRPRGVTRRSARRN
jgi:hypothetical protein